MGDSTESGVYQILNKINGKRYIGSAVNFMKRWSDHRTHLIKNIHPNGYLQKSVNKYGIDSFNFEIVEKVTDLTQLLQREQYWMDYYKSSDDLFGYNIRLNAQNNKGLKHSDETKQKMRLAHLGKKQSLEHIKNAADSHRGKKRTEEQAKRCARTWSDEQRQQRSEQQKQIFKRDGISEETRQKCRDAALKQWELKKQI